MKITGYSDTGLAPEDVQHLDLAEITITAAPDEIRKFSAFLAATADKMEQMGAAYGHEHLADRQKGFEQSPHVTVFSSSSDA